MSKEQLSTQELIRFKQQLQMKYPGAVGKLKGGDAIFLQKEFGDDVIIYSSGVAVFKKGFTASPKPRKFSNIKEALDAAIREGYRPFPAFQTGWIQERKLIAMQKKKEFEEATSVFSPVEEKPLREIKEEYGGGDPQFIEKQERFGQKISQQPTYPTQFDPNAVDRQLIRDAERFKPLRRPAIKDVGAMETFLGGRIKAIRSLEGQIYGRPITQAKKTKKRGRKK